MRVVVAHPAGSDIHSLRQALLGAGLECTGDDCVDWPGLGARLVQGNADLLIVKTDNERDLDWDVLREATSLVMAPILAVGPMGDIELATRARRVGAVAYLDQANLRDELDGLLDQMSSLGAVPQRLGTVISVLAPTPGSGGSTVAVNLAGALAREHPREVGLIELSRGIGDVAMLLGADPENTVRGVCQRFHTLDAMSLRNSFLEHPSGLNLLVHPIEPSENEFLNVDSVRRLCVLARVVFSFTVVALDGRVADDQLEAMRLSNTVFVVVRADVPSVRRARWAIDAATSQGIPRQRFRPVINRWGQAGQLSISQVETSLEFNGCALIPDDPKRVNSAANQGVLLQELSQSAKISRRFARLAASVNKSSKPKKKHFWASV